MNSKALADALENSKRWAAAVKALPEDHQLGMRVAKGGSMCGNCEYLKSPTECGNRAFVRWNGGAELPEANDEYCCDLWEGK